MYWLNEDESDSDAPLPSKRRATRGKPTVLTRMRESFEIDSDIVNNQKLATPARKTAS
jgi:hypothetical protein